MQCQLRSTGLFPCRHSNRDTYIHRHVSFQQIRGFFFSLLLTIVVFADHSLGAQTANRSQQTADIATRQPLTSHHPQWANPANDAGALLPDQPLDQMTLVVARSPQQEAAFTQFLADQQNPASPSYHHWLTPAEIGERFGPSDEAVAAITTWLQSQGLRINWTAPSKAFIGFGGTAADVSHAFQTEVHAYSVNGHRLISIASDPVLPAALASSIRSIRGLYTIEDEPQHSARVMSSDDPELTLSSGAHYMTPADFNIIYDVSSTSWGNGQTIGIVGRSRTDFADFDNLRQKTGASFQNPTEVVPTALGGIDPGPAYTAPPASGTSLGDQLEASLDVLRAGSVAPYANLLLVVATNASGGIGVDTQYLVQTTPLPASTINISFGACESKAGPAGVNFWDSLFQQAAAEGISVFVSSGDSGASGCDADFTTPPASPSANSPNYICSSSYATCVGGTEFNDTDNPSQYWSSSNSQYLNSALQYIPEGGWNEPLNSHSSPQIAASGGGVSSVIPTPSWQTGTGVPTARAGRYTPDLAFSASGHDGYFACFAAAGASCVSGSNGSFQFEYFSGTSAAAPSMAAITALLDAQIGAPQGNLNPYLYTMVTTAPSAFHDITVTSSGVANCQLDTPSMCNNSAPGTAGLTGGQTGYLVTTGYDEVTGLGSLNVVGFINSYQAPPTLKALINTPGQVDFGTVLVSLSATAQIVLQNTGSSTLNGFAVALSGPNASDFSETTDCQTSIDAGSTCTVNLTFQPSAAGHRSSTLTFTSSNAVNAPLMIILSGTGNTTPYVPNIFVIPSPQEVTVTQSLSVLVEVNPPVGGLATPTGSVVVSSTGYTSASVPLANGSATVTVPAGALPLGQDLLTAVYTPDAASSVIFSSTSGSYGVSVAPESAETFVVQANSVNIHPGATTNNSTIVAVSPMDGFTGTVTLSAAITTGPPSPHDPPIFSFGASNTVAITNAASQALTLTITTTAPSSSALAHPASGRTPWYAAGGATFACLLFLIGPARLRRWRSMLAVLLLLVAFIGGAMACGGGGSKTSPTPPPPTEPGTTLGGYTITITGTSGSKTVTTTFELDVL